MTEPVVVSVEGNVLVMTLNRPGARNAVNGATARALAEALDELDGSDALGVGVLTGAGGVFCSGMDLKAFLAGETPAVPGRGFGGLTQAPPRKPLIAAVEGWALAGGLELVLACDLVIAGQGARFGVPEVKRGLVAAGGGALLLPARIPVAIALEMLLSGDPISAERAAQVGLVNAVVPDGHALQSALELARRVGRNGPLALAATKEIARHAPEWSAEERWHEQRRITDPVFASADAREGATAFAERREPVWRSQ